jgi:hypothetical protein
MPSHQRVQDSKTLRSDPPVIVRRQSLRKRVGNNGVRAYPATLQNDLANFFEALFPTSVKHRKEAGELFDRVVTRHAEGLLNEHVPYTALNDSELSAAEFFKQNPTMALNTVQLFTRAIRFKTQAHLFERKIDVRRLLSERVRLIKAKGKVAIYTRRII